MTDGIALIAYETPHAPCGGIAAVIGRLTRQMQKASGLATVVITPFHHQIEKIHFAEGTHSYMQARRVHAVVKPRP